MPPRAAQAAWPIRVLGTPPHGWAPSAEAPEDWDPTPGSASWGPCCAPCVRAKTGPSVCREEDGLGSEPQKRDPTPRASARLYSGHRRESGQTLESALAHLGAQSVFSESVGA